MRMFNFLFTSFCVTGVLGMLLDISGLYLAIKMREKNLRKHCKFFYKMMHLGEFFLSLSNTLLTLTIITFTLNYIDKFI